MSPAFDDALHLADCRHCGTLQRMPSLDGHPTIDCAVCATALVRSRGRSRVAALACAVATLLLLIPANLLPFLTTSILGASRQSHLVSSATAMVGDGFPELAIVLGLFVVVLPLLRFTLLVVVLGSLQLGFRPPWLGRLFRLAGHLQPWAMADVYLLAFAVAYARLQSTIAVEIDAGALCFIAAAVLTLLTRATLDTAEVWRAIGPDRSVPVGAEALSCNGCDLVLPTALEGGRCPRCAARLHRRKPGAVGRAAALAIAAALLYVPANIYTMATLPIGLSSVHYTVLEGVIDLIDSGLLGLGLMVFIASFAIPLAKLGVLAWCITSVLRRSDRRLLVKTRLHRAVEEIGRWSMVDPFVIGCFVPVTQYNALIHGSAGPAATLFTTVVVLTTLSARCFDPRQLWDAAATRKPA